MSNQYSGAPLGTILSAPGCGDCATGNPTNCSGLGPEYGSTGGYTTCSSCQYWDGASWVIGNTMLCRKNQYLGNSQTCCAGLPPSGYPNVTCNPNYSPSNPQCTSILQPICNYSDYIFSKSYCNEWGLANPSLAFEAKKNYCSSINLPFANSSPQCAQFVQSSSAQGKLDTMMSKYCKNYPSDPLCSCINSPLPCPNKYDKNCIQNNGYLTYSMINTNCPNVVNCNQFTNLSPGALALGTSEVQNCTSNTTTGSGSGTGTSSGSTSSSSGTTSTKKTTLNTTGSNLTIEIVVIIVLVILFILLATVIILWVRHKRKSHT